MPLLGALLALTAATAARPSPASVAVLVEPGMAAYGGTPALSARLVVPALARLGIQATAITAAEAADPATLNTQRITVLVLPYGNAFPEPAYANLRAFHAAGGCLVLTGIPFCHPCKKVNGRWIDSGHDSSRFGHDAAGIGTGGFAGPGESPGRLAVPIGNPLGIPEQMLARREAGVQWLDTASLDPADQVTPITQVTSPTGESHPAAALITHRCGQFRGARDVWIGQVASGGEEADRYTAEQLIARGVLWCLTQKSKLPAGELRARLAALGKIRKPAGLPAGLVYDPGKRPWGESFLPRSNPPARRLIAVDVSKLPADVRMALTCLQGLTSRRQPVIWLIRSDLDRTWLDRACKQGHIGGYSVVSDWRGLFRKFHASYRGAVVPDTRLYRSDLLAVDVAACEDLIIAAPELAASLGIPIKVDLRGRFSTYAEGLEWVWKTYRGRLNHYLCNYMHPARLANCVFSYDLQWRGVVFWIAGTVDENEPGADPVAERRVVARILSEVAPNTAVMGFPYGGEGVGIGEGGGVELASRYAKGLVCSDFLGNVCVTSGIRIDHLAQPVQPAPPLLEKDKIYIALVMSDGDNENTWIDFFERYFDDPAFGTFPLAFGMGPPIREILPHVAQWYYEHASPTTEFIADVSGMAYTQPDVYGAAYKDRESVLDGFLDWTARLMKPMGMRTVRTVGGGDEGLERYARALPFCHSLFADMGRYSGREGIRNLTYSLPEGMPVFRAVTSWRYGKNGFLREVREQVGDQRPAFVNGFVHCWTFGMDDLARIYRERDPDMVFVTPAQLAALYRLARKQGWAR